MRSIRTRATGFTTLFLVLSLATACSTPTGPGKAENPAGQDTEAPVALDVNAAESLSVQN